MANITFRIRESKVSGASARVVADISMNRKRKFFTTNVKVVPDQWDQKKQRPRTTCINRKIVDAELKRVRDAVTDAYYEKCNDGFEPFFQKFLALMQHESGKNLSEAWEEFIQASNYAYRTEQKMRTTLKSILEYNRNVSPEGMNLRFIDGYKNNLFKRDLSNETASKYVQCIKRFMSWSFDRGYHTCTDFRHKDFSVPRMEKLEHIGLTEEEVEQIRTCVLPERLELSRDLFLWSCYTGQRWSDIERLEEKNVQGDRLTYSPWKTRKHAQRITVPLIGYSAPAVSILEKYEGMLPKMLSQVFNRQIKEVCVLAGIEGSIDRIRRSGKKEEVIKIDRATNVSAHTGRRTFATILITKGVPLNIVAKMTGHKSIKTLQKYEQAGADYALQMYVQNWG